MGDYLFNLEMMSTLDFDSNIGYFASERKGQVSHNLLLVLSLKLFVPMGWYRNSARSFGLQKSFRMDSITLNLRRSNSRPLREQSAFDSGLTNRYPLLVGSEVY